LYHIETQTILILGNFLFKIFLTLSGTHFFHHIKNILKLLTSDILQISKNISLQQILLPIGDLILLKVIILYKKFIKFLTLSFSKYDQISNQKPSGRFHLAFNNILLNFLSLNCFNIISGFGVVE